MIDGYPNEEARDFAALKSVMLHGGPLDRCALDVLHWPAGGRLAFFRTVGNELRVIEYRLSVRDGEVVGYYL